MSSEDSEYYREQEIDPKDWSNAGFVVAINYLNAWIGALGEKSGVDFNQKNFKLFVDTFVGRNKNLKDIIEKDYFANSKFYFGEFREGESYPEGTMPNPKYPPFEPEHIPLSLETIIGVPRPDTTPDIVTQWLEARRNDS